MTETFEAEELSEREPEADPNHWPMPDYEAFVAAYGRALSLIEAFGKVVDADNVRERNGLAEAAVREALRLIGLPSDHWLGDSILAGCFGLFRRRSDGRVRSANAFLRFLDHRDLSGWPKRQIAWARKLDAADRTH